MHLKHSAFLSLFLSLLILNTPAWGTEHRRASCEDVLFSDHELVQLGQMGQTTLPLERHNSSPGNSVILSKEFIPMIASYIRPLEDGRHLISLNIRQTNNSDSPQWGNVIPGLYVVPHSQIHTISAGRKSMEIRLQSLVSSKISFNRGEEIRYRDKKDKGLIKIGKIRNFTSNERVEIETQDRSLIHLPLPLIFKKAPGTTEALTAVFDVNWIDGEFHATGLIARLLDAFAFMSSTEEFQGRSQREKIKYFTSALHTLLPWREETQNCELSCLMLFDHRQVKRVLRRPAE